MPNARKTELTKMDPEQILSLPIRERRKVIDGFDDKLGFLKKLKSQNIELPLDLEMLHDILEKDRIKNLPIDERIKLFNKQKEKWSKEHSNFRRLTELMKKFSSNELLNDYCKHSPPHIIQAKAVELYKKCLSFKVKLTRQQIKSLVYFSTIRKYCINPAIVFDFVNDYQQWNFEIYKRWKAFYYLRQDFNFNEEYESDWEFYIKHPNILAEKVNYIENGINEIILLLNQGLELIEKHNIIITEEYKSNSYEMSLYERELEISRIAEPDNRNEEEHCYVYTLECDMCIFYVGIAANPKLRFDQHLRGAFSNERHLLKSKFIQKYQHEVKQKLIFEGTRRDCRRFERDYISEYQPLGNMTEGGEG